VQNLKNGLIKLAKGAPMYTGSRRGSKPPPVSFSPAFTFTSCYR